MFFISPITPSAPGGQDQDHPPYALTVCILHRCRGNNAGADSAAVVLEKVTRLVSLTIEASETGFPQYRFCQKAARVARSLFLFGNGPRTSLLRASNVYVIESPHTTIRSTSIRPPLRTFEFNMMYFLISIFVHAKHACVDLQCNS